MTSRSNLLLSLFSVLLLLLLILPANITAIYSDPRLASNEISVGPVGPRYSATGECDDCRNFCGDCKYCKFCDIFGCRVNSNCKSCWICKNCVAGADCENHCGTTPVSWNGQGKQCKPRELLTVLILKL